MRKKCHVLFEWPLTNLTYSLNRDTDRQTEKERQRQKDRETERLRDRNTEMNRP